MITIMCHLKIVLVWDKSILMILKGKSIAYIIHA